METEERGTRDKPVIVDSPRTVLYVDELNHVHDLDGNCIKNRYAVRCDPPLPLPPHGDYQDAIKTVTGMARTIARLERELAAARMELAAWAEAAALREENVNADAAP